MLPELKLHPVLLFNNIQTMDVERVKTIQEHLTFSIH